MVKTVEEILIESFGAKVEAGALVFSEHLFEDARKEDVIDAQEPFTATHTSVFLPDTGARPFIHAVREGYRLPGLRATGAWAGRHQCFSYHGDLLPMEAFKKILRRWSQALQFIDWQSYQRLYPKRFWQERHTKDQQHFFAIDVDAAKTIAPGTIVAEPRATHDLADLARDQNLVVMGEQGLRRAIKFASRASLVNFGISKGQRCTSIIVAAAQAAILEPIVRQCPSKIPFKQFKGMLFDDYCDQVLIENWRDHPLGKKLFEAHAKKDYSLVFGCAFNVDQRYITPQVLLERIKRDGHFSLAFQFNYFENLLDISDGANHQIIELKPVHSLSLQ